MRAPGLPNGKARVEKGTVIGNTYDKYHTTNPVARRLVRGFLRDFDELVTMTDAHSVMEVGCGEGDLSLRIARSGKRVIGFDISPTVVEAARARAVALGLEARFEVGDVLDPVSPENAPDLVICCEVLEHIAEAEAALERLRALGAARYLFSVPREPVWRLLNVARGAYLRELGNTPGHLRHWSRSAFLSLIGTRFTVVAVRSPLPWTMVLARLR